MIFINKEDSIISIRCFNSALKSQSSRSEGWWFDPTAYLTFFDDIQWFKMYPNWPHRIFKAQWTIIFSCWCLSKKIKVIWWKIQSVIQERFLTSPNQANKGKFKLPSRKTGCKDDYCWKCWIKLPRTLSEVSIKLSVLKKIEYT